MKKNMLIIAFVTILSATVAGCSTNSDTSSPNQNTSPSNDLSTTTAPSSSSDLTIQTTPTSTPEEAILEKINAEKAREMMDASPELIILDVRTIEEYEEGHIEGALLIPDYEIGTKAEELLTDKDATILVYCRSGRRSALASQSLNNLGYTSIYDFGGIIDWPYDVVTD